MKKIVATFTLILLFLTTVSASVAWFATQSVVPSGAEITTGYFARGEGTAEEPYVINRPIHLYNLAWLQNFGRFNQTFGDDGNLVQYHFVIESDVDMSDYVLPPIGTAEYPFIGTFRTLGTSPVTIKNLTVSNIVDNGEITASPHGVNELANAEIVGMFGIVGQYNNVPSVGYNNIVPMVSDFYLDEPTIRTHTDATLIGLIAGYVNGKVHEVGVKGGTLVSGANNTSGLSNNNISIYSLIGDRAGDVNWGGVSAPGGGAGGALKVDANDSATLSAVEAVENGSYYEMVPNSEERAFFVSDDGSVTPSAFNGKIGTVRFYKHLVTKNDSFISADASSDFVSLTNTENYNQSYINANINSEFVYNEDLAYRLTHGGLNTIKTGSTPPTPTDTQKIPTNIGTVDVPNGGIWFKPIATGDCIISFGVPNMRSDRYKSIYRFTRNDDAEKSIDQSSFTETKLHFDTKTFSNKDIIIYHFEITKQDIDEGAEYVIGTSTGESDNDIMFYFLALAGTSNVGGEITATSKELFEVNFINSIPYGYDTIYGPDNKITTFVVSMASTGGEASVSYSRASMTEHANAETSNSSLEVTKYEHIGIPPDEQS